MAIFTLALAVLLRAAPAQAGWTAGPPLPQARSEVAVAADAVRVYVVGGNGAAGAVNTLFIYDTGTGAWRSGAPVPGPARDHIGAAVVGGTLYAIGGLVAWPDQAVASVYAYDPAADAWTPRAPLPRPRGAMGVAALGNQIYAAGGLAGGDAVADFTVFDPATNTWTMLAPMPTTRDHLMAGALGTGFHAVGGRDRDIGGVTSAHEMYDTSSRSWKTLAPLPTPRGGGGAATLFGKLYVFGGELPGGTLNVLEIYDPQTGGWETGSPLAHPRHGLGGAAVGNALYAPGGGPEPGFSVSAHVELLAVEPPPAPPACPTSGAADDDADGFTNGEEAKAGSDPCDRTSAPAPAPEDDRKSPDQTDDDVTAVPSVTGTTSPRANRDGGGCQSSDGGMNTSMLAAAALVLFMMRRPGP